MQRTGPMPWLRTAIASALLAALGMAALHAATDGLQAFTYDSARQLRALRSAQPLPTDLVLELHDGSVRTLGQWREPVLVVDFVYTRCRSVCLSLGALQAQLRAQLANEIARGDVRLLSVSLDPVHDDPARLAAHRGRFAQEAEGWDLGRPPDAQALARWLEAFGVVLLTDREGELVHNATLALVGPERRIRTFLSPEAAALASVLAREELAALAARGADG